MMKRMKIGLSKGNDKKISHEGMQKEFKIQSRIIVPENEYQPEKVGFALLFVRFTSSYKRYVFLRESGNYQTKEKFGRSSLIPHVSREHTPSVLQSTVESNLTSIDPSTIGTVSIFDKQH
jgi:hypothetical protein